MNACTHAVVNCGYNVIQHAVANAVVNDCTHAVVNGGYNATQHALVNAVVNAVVNGGGNGRGWSPPVCTVPPWALIQRARPV
jgi:hypothetical protein